MNIWHYLDIPAGQTDDWHTMEFCTQTRSYDTHNFLLVFYSKTVAEL